uniref:Uncharacterized protein n=1 Tax=Strombidium rassoulzadegani TaxID=1082188 RepID=A0A7S3FTN7_9SPIT|eukprot:CAMPEP_0168609096 /NCGR_PEP_ID=MMETSP0449_2-20121227/1013_1 /TAXON_ID=1082188 /ORGANISM="Strombidium rassoulzadegani, Strain ras09" /LENGTH=189 /DNA_ID=CAMNT_0008649195 /DNA_START=19 /DNA_END=588 /DNA_ORIENTATION=+
MTVCGTPGSVLGLLALWVEESENLGLLTLLLRLVDAELVDHLSVVHLLREVLLLLPPAHLLPEILVLGDQGRLGEVRGQALPRPLPLTSFLRVDQGHAGLHQLISLLEVLENILLGALTFHPRVVVCLVKECVLLIVGAPELGRGLLLEVVVVVLIALQLVHEVRDHVRRLLLHREERIAGHSRLCLQL